MAIKEWKIHCIRRRPHFFLGPGFPDSSKGGAGQRPQTRDAGRSPHVKKSMIGGLHYACSLMKEAA